MAERTEVVPDKWAQHKCEKCGAPARAAETEMESWRGEDGWMHYKPVAVHWYCEKHAPPWPEVE